MKPRLMEIDGTAYDLRPPTGGDWLAVAGLDPIERTLLLIVRCVSRDGRPAFRDQAAAEGATMALIQALDAALSELMAYEIPDPT